MAAAQGEKQLLSYALQRTQPRGRVTGSRTACLGVPLKSNGKGTLGAWRQDAALQAGLAHGTPHS